MKIGGPCYCFFKGINSGDISATDYTPSAKIVGNTIGCKGVGPLSTTYGSGSGGRSCYAYRNYGSLHPNYVPTPLPTPLPTNHPTSKKPTPHPTPAPTIPANECSCTASYNVNGARTSVSGKGEVRLIINPDFD
eukprot:scaffold1077_cov72-Cyclotella_meneghiniana.AAC.1